MRNIIKIALALILLISFSCSKDDSTIANYGKVVNKVAIVSDSTKIIQANLIETNPNLYIVEIEITNKKTNETLPTFVHKFTPDNTKEIMKDLPTKMKSFNGTFTIEVEGQILLKSIIKNGIVKESKINKFASSFAMKAQYPCTIDGITSCADDRINSMNWVDYGFCLVDAPLCLAQLYLSCSWDNC